MRREGRAAATGGGGSSVRAENQAAFNYGDVVDQLRGASSMAAPKAVSPPEADAGKLERYCLLLHQYTAPEPGSGLAPDVTRALRCFDRIEQVSEPITAAALETSGLGHAVVLLCEHADGSVRSRADHLRKQWVKAGFVAPPRPAAPPPLPPSAPPTSLLSSECTAAVELVKAGRARWVSFCLDR